MVEHDQADVGLISYPKSTRTITALPWREEPMLLVCHPQHRLATAGVRSLSNLDGEKMIGFDASLTIRREIDRVLDQHGVEVDVVMEFDNIETIKRAVEIDAGLALLPEPTVQGEVAAKSLVAVPLATHELVRPLGIIHRRGKELGSTTHRFIELLQSEAQAECHCQEHAGTNGEAKNGSVEMISRDYSLSGSSLGAASTAGNSLGAASTAGSSLGGATTASNGSHRHSPAEIEGPDDLTHGDSTHGHRESRRTRRVGAK
jgi:hypothetical protein